MSQWLRAAIGPEVLSELDRVGTGGRPGGRVTGFSSEAGAAIAAVAALVANHSLPGARAVRFVWFSKDEDANWGVPWHQDRVIAVAARHDLPGYSNWSLKSGIWHCEPPVDQLRQMRFVRVHLDDCDDRNGAMQIAVGSDVEGAVQGGDAPRIAAGYPCETCAARRGDVQILPMLTLHRSLPATVPARRRVIRLDFAAFRLPAPLDWIEAGT